MSGKTMAQHVEHEYKGSTKLLKILYVYLSVHNNIERDIYSHMPRDTVNISIELTCC